HRRPLQARRPDDTLQGSASRQRLPHPPSTAGLDATPALRRAGLCPVAGEGAVRPGAQPARRSRRLSPGGSHQRARVGGHPRRGPVDARLAGRAPRGDLLRCDLGHAHRTGGECLGGQRLRPEHGSPPSLLGRGREEPRAAGTRPDPVPPASRTRCVPQPTDRQPARSGRAWHSIRSPAVGIREVHNGLQRGGVRAARTGALQAQRTQARSGGHLPVLPRSHATARHGGRRSRQGRAGARGHLPLPWEHHVDHHDDHQHRSPAHHDHAARHDDHHHPSVHHLHHLVQHYHSAAHHDHAGADDDHHHPSVDHLHHLVHHHSAAHHDHDRHHHDHHDHDDDHGAHHDHHHPPDHHHHHHDHDHQAAHHDHPRPAAHHDHDLHLRDRHLDHDDHSGADLYNPDNLHHDHPGANHHDYAEHNHHDAHVRNDDHLDPACGVRHRHGEPGLVKYSWESLGAVHQQHPAAYGLVRQAILQSSRQPPQ